MSVAPAKRASRYTRPLPTPMRLTSRDENIITRCFEDKLLSSSNLQRIFFGTKQRCNRRLRKLYSQDYLDRHYLATPLPYHGSFDALYSLGKRGVDIVALQKGIQRERIQKARQKFAKQLKSYSILFTLAHIQAVAKVRIAFEKAFENHELAELINWTPERLLEQRFYYDDKRLKLRPDGFMQYLSTSACVSKDFGTERRDAQAGQIKSAGKMYSAFLEIDLGTQSKKQIQDKVRRYLVFSETDLPQEAFSTRWFRVIFISTGERRSQEIKVAIESITEKIFWITDVSKLSLNDWLDKPIFLRVGMSGRHPLP